MEPQNEMASRSNPSASKEGNRAPCSHGVAGASAESTERDQLGGGKNVRDADSVVVATDHRRAQQCIHTADY